MRKKIASICLAVLMSLSMGITPAFAWAPTFQQRSGYPQSLQIPDSGFTYFTVSPGFPGDPTMLALTGKGNVYLSPNGGALWVQARFNVPGPNGAQKPAVVHGATRAYLAPDFATSQMGVLASQGGLYSVEFTYGILGNSSPTESQLQFGDYVHMDAANITPPAPPSGAAGSSAFAFGPNGGMYASNGDEIYTSQDNGVDWTALYYATSPVRTITLSPDFSSDNTMMFSTATGVFLSTDGGRHFTQSGVPTASGRYVVRFSPNYDQNRTMAVIVPGMGVYLSTDSGRTWSDVFPHRGAVSLALTNNAVYVGTNASAGQMKGVYASFDQGKTWISEGLTSQQNIAGLVAIPGSGGDAVYALPQNALVQTAIVSAPAPGPKVPAPVQSNTVVFTIGSVAYTVNGQVVTMDAAPFIDSITGRTYVPVRYLAEALAVPSNGITWDAKTGTVTLEGSRKVTIELVVGSNIMTVSDAPNTGGIQAQYVSTHHVQMDTAPEIVNGRTMLPARWMARELGYTVHWNAVKHQIVLTN